MADIAKITLPTGSTYDLKDATARELIADLESYTDFLGVTTTALTDGATTNPITINNESVTAKKGNIVTYSNKEFIFNGTAWQEFGDLSGLGALAFKNSASGTVAVPKTFTTTVTPAAKNVSVSGTTTGSVSVTKSNVTVSKAESGTATYTPEGSVSAPTVSVATAGSTTNINNPTSKTVVTDMSVSNPASATATGELVYCSVSGETLSLKKFVETTGASITTSSITVKNGDASYSASAPSFTGTGARLVTDSEVATGASFTGASMTSTGSYTPATPTTSTTVATTENKTVTVS